MFAGKGQDVRKLVVFHWSDGSRDPFFLTKDSNDFVEWKLHKYPEITYTIEYMNVGEYNAKYIFTDGQN
jgi:hypothetical protein